ncbi:DUF86 domain-containing protein [Candidatus Woesearchaeota archaeon]|nr:DUF86 domain-containing protein [Candidatus Woesearchaeota archaeon]
MNLKQKVIEKLHAMNVYLDELADLLPLEEEYYERLQARRACEKTIELAIEQVIDIASLIVSYQKLGIPHSEDDLFTFLQKKKILSVTLAKKIREMKGFRNVLVHKYGEIDDRKTHHFLTTELPDFQLFEKEIRQFLKKLK